MSEWRENDVTCEPTTTICGNWILSEPTVLKASWSLFKTGIRVSITSEERWILIIYSNIRQDSLNDNSFLIGSNIRPMRFHSSRVWHRCNGCFLVTMRTDRIVHSFIWRHLRIRWFDGNQYSSFTSSFFRHPFFSLKQYLIILIIERVFLLSQHVRSINTSILLSFDVHHVPPTHNTNWKVKFDQCHSKHLYLLFD